MLYDVKLEGVLPENLTGKEWLAGCEKYFSGNNGDSMSNDMEILSKEQFQKQEKTKEKQMSNAWLANAKAFQLVYTHTDKNGNPRRLMFLYDSYFDKVEVFYESSAGGDLINYLRYNLTEMIPMYVSPSEYYRLKTEHNAQMEPIDIP